MTVFSHEDAACLAQLAGAAGRDLSIGAALPPGWSVFETLPNVAPPLGAATTSAQGFIASGALPSDPATPVTVVALAYPLQSYAAWSSANFVSRATGLQPLPQGVIAGNAQALAPAVNGYGSLRGALWQAFGRTAPRDVIVTGAQLGAAMAAICAIDLRPGQTGPDGKTKGPARKSRCLMLSAPAPGNAALAQVLAAETAGAWTLGTTHLGAAIDTFPGGPESGAVAAGTPVAVPAHILAIPDLISGPDTWVQRDSDAYVAALGGDPVDLGMVAAQISATAGFDVLRAAALSDMIGLPYLLSAYPGLGVNVSMLPYAPGASIADGGTIWGAVAQAPGTTALLFRDAIGWPEFDTLTCDYLPVATPFSGSQWDLAKVHSGAATLFLRLRAAIAAEVKAALSAAPETVLDFAGHGLGGAVAALAAIDTVETLAPRQAPRVWMFGAPVFGSYDFLAPAAALIGPTTIRVNRRADFLPRLGFTFLTEGLGQAVSLLGRPRITDPEAHGLSGYAGLLSPRSLAGVM